MVVYEKSKALTDAPLHYCPGCTHGIIHRLVAEALEELGLTAFNPVYLTSYVFESEVERELVNVFAAVGSFELKPDLDEVDEGRWWPVDEVNANMGKGIFTPNFESEFTSIEKKLLALL